MSEQHEPPFALDVRVNSYDVIIRSLIAVLTPEQRKKFDTILTITLRNLSTEQSLDPDKVSQISSAVRFMNSHLPR